jgi:hypothetical protein
MGKGYAEGPAAEEAERRLDELAAGPQQVAPEERAAVYGSTADEPVRHFLGWLDDVDPDALFASGVAYGITVVRRATGEAQAASLESRSPTVSGAPSVTSLPKNA